MKLMKRSFIVVWVLIVVTGAALAYVNARDDRPGGAGATVTAKQGPVAMTVHTIQDKVLKGSDGRVSVALTLTAGDVLQSDQPQTQHADLVVVLDRSGSMSGQKIHDARLAVLRLIERLTGDDRLAVVAYSDGVQTVWPLSRMTDAHREQAAAAVQKVFTGGGTNLGGGLSQGIATLMQAPARERQRKLILISDGLANQGITDPVTLGSMASGAAEHNFTVSTVGVGLDFNEILMTTLADHGAGRYYFLEDPQTFARVFDKELQATRTVAAAGLEIRIPQNDGVRLIHAGGYPITTQDGQTVVRPGDLLSGQQRRFYLTYQVPTDKERRYELGTFHIRFTDNGVNRRLTHNPHLSLACMADPRAVMASIDKDGWGDQVLREDYSQLKEEVATAIRMGQKERALTTIREYEASKRKVNAAVGSAKVAKNLDHDVQRLRQSVEDTFAGAPAAVAEKKKQRSKALQYESYQTRRDKK
jgi:Ca-activated chloride channel family protein